jgi:hypothetical protein
MICERDLVIAVGSDRIAVKCNVVIVSRIRIGMFWGRECGEGTERFVWENTERVVEILDVHDVFWLSWLLMISYGTRSYTLLFNYVF